MAHEFLNHREIHLCLVQPCGKGGPEHMGIDPALNPRPFRIQPDLVPDRAGMEGTPQLGQEEVRWGIRVNKGGSHLLDIVCYMLGPAFR